MFKNGFIVMLATLSAVFCRTDSAIASSVTGRILVEPLQETYYIGQKARLVIEITMAGLEMSSDISIRNLPKDYIGFSDFRSLPTQEETKNGELVSILKFVSEITILRDGEFSINPRLSGSFFEEQEGSGFMARFRVVKSLTVDTTPARIVASKLPEPRPKDFTGAVGNFKLSAGLSPTHASPGDILTLKWQISGYGSLDGFTPPEYNPGEFYKNYPAKEDFIEKDRKIAFTQSFIPTSLNAAVPPPISMSVFDPIEGAYFSLFSDPFELVMTEYTQKPVVEKPTQPVWTPPPTATEPSAADTRMFSVTADTVAPLLIPLTGVMLAVIVFAWLFTFSKWLAVAASAIIITGSVICHKVDSAHRERSIHSLASVAEARICPSSAAKIEMEIPAGTPVRILEKTERWARVEWHDASVWIPASAIK